MLQLECRAETRNLEGSGVHVLDSIQMQTSIRAQPLQTFRKFSEPKCEVGATW